jgi:hypothetical protein
MYIQMSPLPPVLINSKYVVLRIVMHIVFSCHLFRMCAIISFISSKISVMFIVLIGIWVLVSVSVISVISWWSVLLVEETAENHRPAASH